MKISTYTLSLLLLLSVTSLSAQSVNEIKADPNTYMFGEGFGASIKTADNGALSDIISQISVTIIDELDVKTQQISTQSGATLEESVKSMINTYSSATLTNTRRIIIENEPDAHVFRYIRRDEVDRIFDSRKAKINTMLEEAQEALDKRQINDALRYYYWSHALLKSLRYPNEVYVYDDRGEKQMANVWIPKRINEIFDNLKISVSNVSEDQLNLNILYKSDRVNSVDYTYFDGQGWSNIYTGQDGEGILELRKNFDQASIRLKVEFAFLNEAVIDPEVKEILNVVPEVSYKKAYKNLSTKASESPQQTNSVFTAADIKAKKIKSQEAYSYPELTQIDDITPYQKVIDKVVLGILSKESAELESLFTESGLRAYKQLIEYGSARIVDASTPKYYSLGDHTYCRNILMNFSFKGNNRSFMESVVFEFDKRSRISNVTFGLSRQSTDDIFKKSSWPEQARIILIHFLEGYKSAYALKQIEYIENVFADDALIITGSYTRKATVAEMQSMDSRNLTVTTHSKTQYVSRLKSIFKGNEYINLRFTDTSLIKAGKGGEIYGIELKQEYNSTNYGDTGYLFLMVDLNDMRKPVIHVRTWQPEKDPNFGTYGLAHF